MKLPFIRNNSKHALSWKSSQIVYKQYSDSPLYDKTVIPILNGWYSADIISGNNISSNRKNHKYALRRKRSKMSSLKDRINKGYEIDESTEQGVKTKKFIHSRRSRHNQKKSKEWGWNSPSHHRTVDDTNTKAPTNKSRKRHRSKITRKSYDTHRFHDTRRFYSPSADNNKDVVKLLSLLGQYINGVEDSNHRSIYDKVINELLDDEADLETITALLSAISVTNNEKQTDNYYEGITPSTTTFSKEEIEQKKASIIATMEAAVAQHEEQRRQQSSINNTTLAGGDDSDVDDLADEMQGMSPSKPDNPNPSKRSKNNPNDGSDNKGGGSNGSNSGGSGSNNSDNDDDDDEPMNDAELNDEDILEKLVEDCAGGSWMFEPLRYILTYDGDNKLMLEMKCGVEEVIKIVKERLLREDIASAMALYDEKIQKAVTSIHEDYESLVNMGDGPILGASAMALLNYATTKESIRAWLKEVDGDWIKDPSSQRGEHSLMDPKASECLRMVVQTFARATLNAFRTTNEKDAIDSNLFCESIILLDMCFIAFDNPGNTEAGYKKQVNTIGDNLDLEDCADELAAEIGGSSTSKKASEKASEEAKRMLVFAASSIKYLFQSLHHRAEKAENNPLPFIVFSSYPDKYWFKGKSGEVKRDLIHKIGTMYHPDFCLRKFGRAMSAEAIKEKNKILYNFYRHVKEVREEMMTAIGDDGNLSIIDDISLIHQIFERVDKPMTDAEREEQYQLRLAGCRKGGNEAARLAWLAQDMKNVNWDASQLTGLAKEEYAYFMSKHSYNKVGGATLLKKNMESALAGREKGGEESSRLLVLAQAMEDVGWDVGELTTTSKDEYDYFLSKPSYSANENPAALLEKNMKSRLAGFTTLLSLTKLCKAINDGKLELDGTFGSDEDQAVFDDLLKNKYNNDEKRLLQVIKNRLNGWTVCQNVRRLRIAFMNKSTTISPEGYNQLDKEDKDLFDATTKMELADGNTIGENKLYEMIAASALGWSFCIKLPRLVSILVRTAKERNISVETQSDVFTMEVYSAMSYEDEQEFTSIASEMKLKSTNGQPVELSTLLEKMRIYHNDEYNEKVLDRHINKCKQFMEDHCRDDIWYIPDCMGNDKSTHSFIWKIRDLESGDYGYWKVQAFADAGVDLSKWDQSINVDIKDKEKDKITAPRREERRAVKSREKKKVVTKKT